MGNLFLLLLAYCLKITLGSIAFIYTHLRFIYFGIRKKSFKYINDNLGKYYYECAYAEDVSGNPLLQWMLNDWAVKPDSPYRFGKIEPLSKTFGLVKSVNKDYPFGRFIASMINAIAALMKDYDHVENAANSNT